MSNRKALLLTFIICGLFAFVIIYTYNYRIHVFEWIKNIFFAMGCWYGIKLTYKMIITPDSNEKYLEAHSR